MLGDRSLQLELEVVRAFPCEPLRGPARVRGQQSFLAKRERPTVGLVEEREFFREQPMRRAREGLPREDRPRIPLGLRTRRGKYRNELGNARPRRLRTRRTEATSDHCRCFQQRSRHEERGNQD